MPLNNSELTQLLTESEIAYIATIKLNGDPHIAPIWFIYHAGKIYFETDITTAKFKNIRKRNRVAICFGGKNTYIVEGSVKWCKEADLKLPIRQMYWKKYSQHMQDDYINEKTLLFELIIDKEMSWHYAPEWD